ncbi:MAG: COX15/CtaA family protein, partial [Luteimonas sp.]
MNFALPPTLYKHLHRLAWFAVVLAFGVIVFGAFVRLSNAGLSCPDWPTCYGRASWPAANETVDHAATAIRPLEIHKAWREQLHRMLAGALGAMVFALALIAARKRKLGIARICVASALIALAIPLYMRGQYGAALALAACGEAILLFAALRWDNHDLSRATAITLAVIVMQALLGMWTVTWLLKPIVVMSHLLGGMLTFA